MRVAFDSRPAADDRGIGRYARSLLAALRDGGYDVVEQRRPRGVDVFHAPWIDGARLRARTPQVVTLHDLTPLKRPREYLRTGVRFRLQYAAVRRAQRVIVPTRAVAVDAAQLLGLERVDVVHSAPAPVFAPRSPEQVRAARERYGLPEQYLLWVGGLVHEDPRKRVRALAAAPRSLPLVLAGRPGPWTRELDGVLLAGHVPDEDLAALYTGAHALVLASDDEGFGLPPVEALACGAPVVASDIPAVREVVGDRATLVDAADVAGLVAAAEGARRPPPGGGPSRTWADVARDTWAVYAAALA